MWDSWTKAGLNEQQLVQFVHMLKVRLPRARVKGGLASDICPARACLSFVLSLRRPSGACEIAEARFILCITSDTTRALAWIGPGGQDGSLLSGMR